MNELIAFAEIVERMRRLQRQNLDAEDQEDEELIVRREDLEEWVDANVKEILFRRVE